MWFEMFEAFFLDLVFIQQLSFGKHLIWRYVISDILGPLTRLIHVLCYSLFTRYVVHLYWEFDQTWKLNIMSSILLLCSCHKLCHLQRPCVCNCSRWVIYSPYYDSWTPGCHCKEPKVKNTRLNNNIILSNELKFY